MSGITEEQQAQRIVSWKTLHHEQFHRQASEAARAGEKTFLVRRSPLETKEEAERAIPSGFVVVGFSSAKYMTLGFSTRIRRVPS